MKKNESNIKNRILFPLVIAILALLGVSLACIYWLQEEQLDGRSRAQIAGVQKGFRDQLTNDARAMDGLLDFLARDEGLQKAWLAGDRAKLLAYARPIFESLRAKYNVTHFYFIAPGKVCFLRVHNPSRFGDTIGRSPSRWRRLIRG